MLKKLKEIYNKEQFIPSFLSIFINPYYFIRKGLLKGIKKDRHYMKGVMLDFGCGSKPYKELFNVGRYVGLDIEQSGHNHKNEIIDFYYDGKKVPFENEYFDSVFSSEVFEHLFNLEEILTELSRVLKKNSYMLITLPFVWDEHEVPFDFARYTTFGIKFLLEKSGFKIIDIEKSTNDIETIFQMWNAYLYQDFFPKNKYLKFLMTVLFISLFNLLGIILAFILPKNNNFYHNNIIVAKKITNPYKHTRE